MNSKTKLAIGGAVLLIVGFAGGYASAAGKMDGQRFGRQAQGTGMHMMEGGSMMPGSERRVRGDMPQPGSGTGDMQAMMHSMNAGLEGKQGDEFDRAFLGQMIVHHEGAVQMAEAASSQAKHQEIKDLSRAIIDAQNKEIVQMKAWQSAWYGGQAQ